MKLFLSIFFFLSCLCLSLGQTKADTLWSVWKNEKKTKLERFTALKTICTEQYLHAQPDSAYLLARLAYEFAEQENLQKEKSATLLIMDEAVSLMPVREALKNEKVLAEKQTDYEQKLVDVKRRYQYRQYLLIFIVILMFFMISYLFRKKYLRELKKQEQLQQKIEKLKEKLATQTVSSVKKRKELSLDKDKIETVINHKIGESSWLILNLIFENPSISNKEIAEKVSLSIEGVSSSLRRMYTAFGIKSKGNKKVSLLMHAVAISIQDL